MKKTSIYYSVILLIITSFSSCKKDQVEFRKELKLTVKPLSLATILDIKNKLNSFKLVKPNKTNYQALKISNVKEVAGNIALDSSEAIIRETLLPMIDNGREVHEELVSQLSETEEWQKLSVEEKAEVESVNDEKLVQLSLLASTSVIGVSNEVNAIAFNVERARTCASAALGIAGIIELYGNTLALGTVQTTIGALKLLGRRYLGYFGIALMVWDFTDCYYGQIIYKLEEI